MNQPPRPLETASADRAPGAPVILHRPGEERGRADHGWLQTKHTFSFAGYHDPLWRQFRGLRVINDDVIAPGAGFPTHGHRDMEIITYVLRGVVEHRDSMGNGSTIRPGEIQRMSAGTGVYHSEYNPLVDDSTRLLQIWILPEARGLAPGYEQRRFPDDERRGVLRIVASRNGRDGSVSLNRDVSLYSGLLDAGSSVQHDVGLGRHVWIQLAEGEAEVTVHRDAHPPRTVSLRGGDGLGLSEIDRLSITAGDDSNVLLFDLD